MYMKLNSNEKEIAVNFNIAKDGKKHTWYTYTETQDMYTMYEHSRACFYMGLKKKSSSNGFEPCILGFQQHSTDWANRIQTKHLFVVPL